MLTLVSSGEGGEELDSQGPTGGIATPGSRTDVIPAVPSRLSELEAGNCAGVPPLHVPVSMHYEGSTISGPPGIQQYLPKGSSEQNFVTGTGGPALFVSGGTVVPSGSQSITGMSTVGGTMTSAYSGHGSVIPPYATSLTNPQQVSTTQDNVVSTGSINTSNACIPGSENEGIPVSIHFDNSFSGGVCPADPGLVGVPADGQGAGQPAVHGLKVEDALNYLDKVKLQFGNQPEVYNDFLEIMKEFKANSIDTHGVVDRVSYLFRGLPELILGFNTFLPVGFKIEVEMNDQGAPMQHGVNYKVTTVQTTGLLNQHTSTTVVQQHPPPSTPVRSTVTHTSIPGSTSSEYVNGGGNVDNSVQPASSVIIPNSHATSPVLPSSSSLPSCGNNFENAENSTFTHSFGSPDVQNALPNLESQPVEYNHAITYVNKLKDRFHSQPDKYKQFLEILHIYRKEQRTSKDGAKQLTEHEVYNQVAKLFENQEDLLQEFSQFLPTPPPPPPPVCSVSTAKQTTLIKDVKRPVIETKKAAKIRQELSPAPPVAQQPVKPVASAKRSIKNPAVASAKKAKYTSSFKDVSMTEAGKYGTLDEFAFFDKVRQLLRSQEVYDNFLQILFLFNEEVLSHSQVLELATPFLSREPELLAHFKDFIGHNDHASSHHYEPMPSKPEKLSEQQVLEVDFSTCKRLGASYCALPKNYQPPKCSGRTALCKEVLNDVWVSIPTWSEDPTIVTSRKTQFEEYIYRCEDERFELDVVIETNTETIRCLEAVVQKMSRLAQEELAEFQLDDCLGGTSPTVHQRTIRRLYGEKASDIIEGLMRVPTVTVPMVLKRLKVKENEWREAQKGFNKIWREQVERFYLKSLSHQGVNFKQSDIKALRSKTLITEIETICEERRIQNAIESAINSNQRREGPHLSFSYSDRSVLDDVCNLLLHHVRRQSGIQKEDKRKIKQILKHFIPDLFSHPRMEMSDDENEEEHGPRSPFEFLMNGRRNGKRTNGSAQRNNGGKSKKVEDSEQSYKVRSSGAIGKGQESRRTMAKRELKMKLAAGKKGMGKDKTEDSRSKLTLDDLEVLTMDEEQLSKFTVVHPNQEGNYRLFFSNNTWYVFLRLHQILCERLTKLQETAVTLSQSEPKESRDPKNSAAIALRLKPKPEIEIEDYYPTFLEMVRNLLDGNMETNAYEDRLREMFGVHAYTAYTMDKVVASAVRQLQNLITDESCQKCIELYHYGTQRGGCGGSIAGAHGRVRAELMYQRRAQKAFGEENCVRVIIYQRNCEMTMELLDSKPPQPESEDQSALFAHVDKIVRPNGNEVGDGGNKLKPNPLFLKRNRKKSAVKYDGKDYLYRNRALPRAQKNHRSVSLLMQKRFKKWHKDWLLQNTTRKDQRDCDAWLKRNPRHVIT